LRHSKAGSRPAEMSGVGDSKEVPHALYVHTNSISTFRSIDIRSRPSGVLTVARSSEGAATCGLRVVQLGAGPKAAGMSAEWKVTGREILS
jgi:hypothetical protein